MCWPFLRPLQCRIRYIRKEVGKKAGSLIQQNQFPSGRQTRYSFCYSVPIAFRIRLMDIRSSPMKGERGRGGGEENNNKAICEREITAEEVFNDEYHVYGFDLGAKYLNHTSSSYNDSRKVISSCLY